MVNSKSTATTIRTRSPYFWFFLNPLRMVRALWLHRNLIRQFTRREIEGRYRGSFLGLLWSFINPLILLLIYTFVFGVIFKARWSQSGQAGLGQFALILFCGLIPFNVFAECVSNSPAMIVNVPNYVKKVIFPLEILPVTRLSSALFHSLISLTILLIANLIVNQAIDWRTILLPLVALPLIFFCLGVMWLLASLGVFLRDISHIVGLVIQVLFYASAIFYPIEILPPYAQQLIRLNPLTSVIANFRRVLLWHMLPDWQGYALWLAATFVFMMLGYTWFMKTKEAFADVI